MSLHTASGNEKAGFSMDNESTPYHTNVINGFDPVEISRHSY
jgi:hypothetical protein